MSFEQIFVVYGSYFNKKDNDGVTFLNRVVYIYLFIYFTCVQYN